MPCNYADGTYTGTGSAITLELGFIPGSMDIFNVTDGDEMHIWFDGMTADTGIITSTAVATNAAGAFTRNAGTASTTAAGVLLGTDLSESAKVYRYRAWAKY